MEGREGGEHSASPPSPSPLPTYVRSMRCRLPLKLTMYTQHSSTTSVDARLCQPWHDTESRRRGGILLGREGLESGLAGVLVNVPRSAALQTSGIRPSSARVAENPRTLWMGCAVSVPHNLVGEGLSDVIGPEPLFLSLPCCPARINTTTLTIATPAGIVKPSLSIQSQF